MSKEFAGDLQEEWIGPLRKIVAHAVSFDAIVEVLVCGHVVEFGRRHYRRAFTSRRCAFCAIEHQEALDAMGGLKRA